MDKRPDATVLAKVRFLCGRHDVELTMSCCVREMCAVCFAEGHQHRHDWKAVAKLEDAWCAASLHELNSSIDNMLAERKWLDEGQTKLASNSKTARQAIRKRRDDILRLFEGMLEKVRNVEATRAEKMRTQNAIIEQTLPEVVRLKTYLNELATTGRASDVSAAGELLQKETAERMVAEWKVNSSFDATAVVFRPNKKYDDSLIGTLSFSAGGGGGSCPPNRKRSCAATLDDVSTHDASTTVAGDISAMSISQLDAAADAMLEMPPGKQCTSSAKMFTGQSI